MACACADCFRITGPSLGMKVHVKPEKLLVKGTLPPDLGESAKVGKFEIVDLQMDNRTNRPSAALKMPNGIGNEMTVDGSKVWAWFVYNDDIFGEEDPTKKPTHQEAPKPVAKPSVATAVKTAFKPGDIVEIKDNTTVDYISAEGNKKGFLVLGLDSYGNLILDTGTEKGDSRGDYGRRTTRVSAMNATLVKEAKVKVGDYLRAKPGQRGNFSGAVTQGDHNIGFKLLEIRGDNAVLETPSNKSYGSIDSKHSGVRVQMIPLSVLDIAPPMVCRVGDSVRVDTQHIPSRISRKLARQKMKVLEIVGSHESFEYTIRLPDGSSYRILDNKLAKNKEEGAVASIKNGMKIRIQEAYRDSELPDSLTTSVKAGLFEVVDTDYDSICVKLPKNCTDAEVDSDYGCKVWWVNKNYVEEKTMTKRERGESADRTGMGFMERSALNVEKGAIKTVGRKLTKAVKGGILRAAEAAGKSNGMDESQLNAGLKMFTVFMEGEFGGALVSTLLGIALAQGAPHLAGMFPVFDDDRVEDMADDMQSEGMAVVMEKAIDLAMTYIAPDIANIFQGLPPKKSEVKNKKVRIATDSKAKKKDTMKVGKHDVAMPDVEEEEVHARPRTRAA